MYGINDLSTYENQQVEFGLLPKGEYKVLVDKLEQRPTKKDAHLVESGAKKITEVNWMVSVKLIVIEGEYKNRIIFDNFNMKNESPQAEQIGRGQFAGFVKACGLNPDTANEDDLINRIVIAKVDSKEQTYNGETKEQNFVRGYLSVGSAAPSKAATTANSGKPAWAKK